ncbi:MAG: tetratricopeptide repeat protein, partial [Nitrospirota bacterium]|nr:tetratricopeptide repeat protein [Nitrospirota bacterium]
MDNPMIHGTTTRTRLITYFSFTLFCLTFFGCSEPKEPWDLHTDQGTTLMEQGKFPEAEQELKSALLLAEQFGEQDPRLIQSLTNLAILYNAKGEPDEAEAFLQQTVAIHEKAPNPETADLAASLSNLGALYVTQKKFDQAQQHFERAIAIREQSQGSNDPETIREIENLAGLFVQQSQYDNAEPYLKRV